MALNEQKTSHGFTEDLAATVEELPSHKTHKRDERFKRRLSNRSGGPRSEAGKAKASQNSLKHGGYAIAPGPYDEYCEFERRVHGYLEPVGFIQTELVSKIAFEMWRSKKIQRYTLESFAWAEMDAVQLDRLAIELGFPFDAKLWPVLNSPIDELALQRRLAEFWRGALDGVGLSEVTEVVEADARLLEIHKEGVAIFDRRGMHQVNHEDFFLAMDRVMLDAENGTSTLGLRLNGAGSIEPLLDYWLFRNAPRISAVRRRILLTNSLQILCDPNLERAQNMADRSISNLLQTFWLMKNTDMTTGRDINPMMVKQTPSYLSVKPK